MANLIGPLLGGVLTVTLGWRADSWAPVPLSGLSTAGIVHVLPAGIGHEGTAGPARLAQPGRRGRCAGRQRHLRRDDRLLLSGRAVPAAAAGYSALGASAVLVVVAILVAFGAPLAGRLVDRRGERLTASFGFLLAASVSPSWQSQRYHYIARRRSWPSSRSGWAWDSRSCPPPEQRLVAPVRRHGRISAVLSIGRAVGAGVGAGIAGIS